MSVDSTNSIHPAARRIALPFLLAALLVLPGVSNAPSAREEAEDVRKNMRARDPAAGVRRLRVAFPHMPGMNEIQPDGTRGGYNYDYLRSLALYQKWRCEYVGFDEDYTNALEMLRDKRADVALCIPKSYDINSKEFIFSDFPAGIFKSMLLVRENQTNFPYVAGAAWNGIRIAVPQKRNVTKRNLHEFAKEKGFTFVEVPCDHSVEARALLREGKVDAAAVNNLHRLSGEKILALFGSGELYAAVRKGDQALLAEINEAGRRLRANSPGIFNELTRKYFLLDEAKRIVFQPAENEFIRSFNASNPPLRAAIAPGRSPLSFYDAETGCMTGILTDLCRLILDRTGLKYEMLTFQTRDAYWNAVRNDEIDLKLDNWNNDSYAEDLNMQLSEPYFNTSFSLLRRVGRTAPVKVVSDVRNGDRNIRVVIDNAQAERVEYPTVRAAAHAVAEGEVDGCYVYSISADYLMNLDEVRRLTAISVPGYTASFAIAIPDNIDPRVTLLLNKAIASISFDELDGIIARYRVPVPPVSLRVFMLMHPFETFGCVAILLLTLFFTSAYIIRRKNQFNANLEVMLKRAQEAERAKSAFLSMMSHEIRTPLNSVIGYSDLLERFNDIREEDRRYYLKSIRVSAKFLLALINDILDISKIESQNFKLSPVPCDIGPILQELSKVFEQRLKAKGVAFDIVLPGTLPTLSLDAVRLRQILFNLVGNAVKFTEHGAITARVTCEENTVADTGDNAARTVTLRIAVEDTGCGVPEDMREQIFQQFVQAKAMRGQRVQGGTGLGLPISRRIARMMGGDITVAPGANNIGSVFTMEINNVKIVPRAAAAQSATAEEQEAADSLPPDFKKKVLVVDDIPFNLNMLSEVVRRCGAEAVTASSPHDAMELLAKTPREEMYMVLTDLWMPNMNGDELAKCIHNLPGYADLPIAVVTADVELKSQSDLAHFADVLYKPITFAAVKKVLVSHNLPPPCSNFQPKSPTP